MGVYRVLYASSHRLGCFIETLGRFRVDVSFTADLALMENGEDDFTALGTARRAWIKGRCIGTADVEGEFADIYALGWVSHLRTALASIAMRLGMEDIDLSSLERAEPRLLTQHAGRSAFELGYAGVCYHSRYGHSIGSTASRRLPRCLSARPRQPPNSSPYLTSRRMAGMTSAPCPQSLNPIIERLIEVTDDFHNERGDREALLQERKQLLQFVKDLKLIATRDAPEPEKAA